ncbi:MAG: hypothetical protein ABR584_11750 [Candidatus Baltobacteraceae bacterium]
MKKRLSFLALFCAALGSTAFADAPKPLRHLVYNFTVGISTNTAIGSSGIGTVGSGIANFGAGIADKGTITVDVLQAVDDKIGKALVLNVSEQAQNGRTAVATPCIVYGDGSIVFDPTLKLNDEERSVIRYLGRGFVDTTKLDANNHWRFTKTNSQGNLQDDFTVKSATNGMLSIEVQSTMHIAGAQALDSTTNGTLVYDTSKTLLQKLHEETLVRQEEGLSRYSTSRTNVDATLASDSM